MPLFSVSSGAALRVTNDCYWIDSQQGFPLTFPVSYYQSDGVNPLNLTGYAVELEIHAGYLDDFTGTPVLVFDQTARPHGQVLLTAASGLAVFTMTAAGSAALARGSYSFRWLRKQSGTLESRTFYGRWRHRA